MLTWKTERNGEQLKVIFEGDVTERAPLLDLTDEIRGTTVIFDVGDITRFNSMGVKNWLKLMAALTERDIRVTLVRCAVPVVHQMNMISGPAGQRPQIIVAPHEWQAARSLGGWTLVGCTVSPAFEFEHFELAPKSWNPT